MSLRAACGWSWVQSGTLRDAQACKFFGGGWMNADGVQECFDRQTGPEEIKENEN